VKRHLDFYDLESALNEVSSPAQFVRSHTNDNRSPPPAESSATSLAATATACTRHNDLVQQYPHYLASSKSTTWSPRRAYSSIRL
jgi:hypothetical protein